MPLIATEAIVPLRAEPGERHEMVTQLLFGEAADLLQSQSDWVQVRCHHDGYEGWASAQMLTEGPATGPERRLGHARVMHPAGGEMQLPPGAVWRSETQEWTWAGQTWTLVSPGAAAPADPYAVALTYLHAPYLWGGRSAMGIDCSGLSQMAFLRCGLALLRDASQQATLGEPVAGVELVQRNDLVFFSKTPGGRVTHVGIANGEGRILHASGRVRIDALTPEGIVRTGLAQLSHSLHSIRRILIKNL